MANSISEGPWPSLIIALFFFITLFLCLRLSTAFSLYQKTLRKNFLNAYDFSYANCQSGRYRIEKNRSPLKEIKSLGEKTEYHLIFSKKTFNPQDVLAFNQVIADLKKKGYLQELADKYNLTLAETGK